MASQYVVVDRLDTIIENLEQLDADLIEQGEIINTEQKEQGKQNRETLRAVGQLVIDSVTQLNTDLNTFKSENIAKLTSIDEKLNYFEIIDMMLKEISTKLDKLDNIVTKLDKVDGTTIEIDTSLLAQQVTSNNIKNVVDDIKEIVDSINTKQGTSTD